MSDQEKKRSKKYNRVREKFDELPLEEKATFLVEAVFTTLTRGIEQAGKAFSEELNSLFDQARERAERRAAEAEMEPEGNGEPGEEAAAEEADAGEGSGETSHADSGDEPAEEKD